MVVLGKNKMHRILKKIEQLVFPLKSCGRKSLSCFMEIGDWRWKNKIRNAHISKDRSMEIILSFIWLSPSSYTIVVNRALSMTMNEKI